ncbi:MAG TPA: hypothetical protein VK157_13930 [Phycisphaerales bacterium]|nr:hypothetical protein [Phycisphaerales bacterium]
MQRSILTALVSVCGCAAAQAQVVDAAVVAKVGDVTPAGAITALGDPYINGNGQPGFLYNAGTTIRGIWIGAGSVFDTTSLETLTGGESTIGISDSGGFIYSPSVSGSDSLYTNFGLLISASQPAPGFPGLFCSFASRPRMVHNGTATWVGGVSATPTGATATRVFYRNPNPSDIANTVRVLAGGDVVQGVTIAATGIGFAYDVSDDGTKYINQVTFTGPTATDAGVVLNATTIIMREGSPSSATGENWQNISIVSINNNGDWMVIGDTDAAAAVDGFIAFNGTMVAREGQLINGLALGGSFGAATLLPNGIIHAIGSVGGVESLIEIDPAQPGQATVIAKVGDVLDFDNDDVGDATLNDFNASASVGPGLDGTSLGPIFANVDITPTATGVQVEAIVNFGTLGCDSIDFNNNGVFPEDQDVIDFFDVLAGGACALCNDIDFNNNGVFPEDQDVSDFFNVLAGGACP